MKLYVSVWREKITTLSGKDVEAEDPTYDSILAVCSTKERALAAERLYKTCRIEDEDPSYCGAWEDYVEGEFAILEFELDKLDNEYPTKE